MKLRKCLSDIDYYVFGVSVKGDASIFLFICIRLWRPVEGCDYLCTHIYRLPSIVSGLAQQKAIGRADLSLKPLPEIAAAAS